MPLNAVGTGRIHVLGTALTALWLRSPLAAPFKAVPLSEKFTKFHHHQRGSTLPSYVCTSIRRQKMEIHKIVRLAVFGEHRFHARKGFFFVERLTQVCFQRLHRDDVTLLVRCIGVSCPSIPGCLSCQSLLIPARLSASLASQSGDYGVPAAYGLGIATGIFTILLISVSLIVDMFRRGAVNFTLSTVTLALLTPLPSSSSLRTSGSRPLG